MLNPRVASRYAKSVLDMAVQTNQLEAVYADMQYLQQLTKGSREFLNLLRSPVVKGDIKTKAVEAVTAGKVSALTSTFVKLMISKTREAVLPEVITSFIQQYKQYKNIQVIRLTTAVPVTEDLRNSIVAQVKKTSNMPNIELETKVDPDIIGGFVLQAGDKLVDASISYDLKEISKQFDNNDFVYKLI